MNQTERLFTRAALENIEETNANWRVDLARLRDGSLTAAALLEFCLDGAEPDREQGWREYVSTLESVVDSDPGALWGSDPRVVRCAW